MTNPDAKCGEGIFTTFFFESVATKLVDNITKNVQLTEGPGSDFVITLHSITHYSDSVRLVM